jgi:hypothetical protein
MTQYVAKTNTGIYPYGIVRKGDVLEQKHLDALGETGLSVLIANGVIGEREDGEARAIGECPYGGREDREDREEARALGERPYGDREDFEDGEELTDLEGLDDLAGDAGDASTSGRSESAPTGDVGNARTTSGRSESAPTGDEAPKKPTSRKRTGGKKQ